MSHHRLPFARTAGILLLTLCALGRPCVHAEEVPQDETRIAPDGQRFLFVVETSSDNRKFENANRQAVFDLVVGGVNGQMRTGDTFGLWTFRDEVLAGEFPMTIWDEERSLEIAGRVAGYLQKQKYSKNPDIGKLIANLRGLADQVGEFSVFIISSGREPMVGTPHDEGINGAYKALTKTSAKSGRPFVTTFTVRKGRVSGASVVLAGDNIHLPERPAPAPRPSPASTTRSNATVNAASQDPVAPTPPPPPRKKVMQIITKTNPPVVVTAPAPSTNDPAAQAEPPSPTVTESSPTTPSVKASAVKNDDAPVAATSSSTASPPAPPAGEFPPSQLAVVPEPAPHASPANPPGILKRAAEALTPAPIVVAARESQAGELPQTSKPGVTSPAIEATAIPSSHGLSPGLLLAVGATLLAAACLLLFLIVRRTAPAPRRSLITQSMDRGWKG